MPVVSTWCLHEFELALPPQFMCAPSFLNIGRNRERLVSVGFESHMLSLKCILLSSVLLTGTLSAQTYNVVSSGKLAGSAGNGMTLYDVYEIIATRSGGSAYANPWADPSVFATFTDPQGGTHTISGFLYSGTSSPYEYHVRFAPRKSWGTGTYSWSLTWDGRTVGSGSFSAATGTNTGFLAKHATNPYSLITENNGKFFYATGSPEQFGYGDNGDGTAGWCYSAVDYGTYTCGISSDTFFGTYSSAGGYLYRSNGEALPAHELSGFNDASSGSGKFTTRLDYGLIEDDVVIHARKYDVHLIWTPVYDPNQYSIPGFDLSNANVKNAFLAYWNYAVARFGAFADIWELYNETSCCSINSPTPVAFQTAVSGKIAAVDPYSHFIDPGGFELANPSKGTNFSAPHHYWTGGYQYVSDDIVNSSNNNGGGTASYKATAPNIPFLFGESGNGSSTPAADCSDQTRYRTMVYTGLFNQAAGFSFWDNSKWGGCGYGALYFGPTTRGYSLTLWNFVQTYWDATATPQSITMESPATTSGYAMGNSGFLSVYAHTLTSTTISLHGQTVTQGDPIASRTFTVRVPTSGMTAQWINPVDGSTVGAPFTPNAGSQQFTVPALATDPSNGHPPPDVLLIMSTAAPVASPLPCDLNGDGVVDRNDVNIIINQTLGMSVCKTPQLSGGSTCTVVGVQRVVNAMLGALCRVGP